MDRGGLAPAYAAARTRLGLIALFLALAAVGWWTAREIEDGRRPRTELEQSRGSWRGVMMAAMMFPSVAPTVALYSKLKHKRALGAPLLFASGYLLVWSAVGLLAYVLARIGGQLFGDVLAWDSAGRWVAGATLLVAAAYELTPLKDVCLGKCRTPLGFLLGSWRDGLSGAVQMGARHGAGVWGAAGP
jgi:predicted metal-binding membrane protein